MGAEVLLDLDRLKAAGAVRADDVLRMRRAFYNDGAISEQEAEALFAVENGSRSGDPEWAAFFVEALTDYVVRQVRPEGYVTLANAEWLVERISADGVVRSATELELLVKVLEEARFAPESLVVFALDQVKHAVLSGEGPLRAEAATTPGVVTAAETAMVRRILYAFGGDHNIAVTRAEAEVLFDINDGIDEAASDPGWSDLFVKAIANHLMALSSYRAPSREEALRQEDWLESRGDLSIGNVLAGMLKSGLSGVWGSYTEKSWEEAALERIEQQRIDMITCEAVTEPEAGWVVGRIGRDGILKHNEQALVEFLKAESPNLHPLLAERIAALG